MNLAIRIFAVLLIIIGYGSMLFLPFNISWCTRILCSGLAIGFYAKSKGLSSIWLIFCYVLILDIIAFTVIAMVNEKEKRKIVHNKPLGMILLIIGSIFIFWGFHETISLNPGLWDHAQGHIFIFYSLIGFPLIFKGFDLLFMKWSQIK